MTDASANPVLWVEYWLTVARAEISDRLRAPGSKPGIVRDLSGLRPGIRERAEAFLAEASAVGTPLRVDETYRTSSRQEFIHEETDVISAAPGTSRHEHGLAFDAWPIGVAYTDASARARLDSLIPLAAKHGLKNLSARGDSTHWENA